MEVAQAKGETSEKDWGFGSDVGRQGGGIGDGMEGRDRGLLGKSVLFG